MPLFAVAPSRGFEPAKALPERSVLPDRLNVQTPFALTVGSSLRGLADQTIYHGLDCPHLWSVLSIVSSIRCSPKIPAAVRVRCRSLRLRVQHNNVVAGFTDHVARIPDEVVVDAVHILVAAMKGDMKAACSAAHEVGTYR